MNDRGCQSTLPALDSDATLADDQLLARFVASRDERAFRQLVGRHAALVLGVCRRVLINHHDAEEAFQATFLVLAQKAARVRIDGTLAPWLYGVAYRISVRAAQKRVRRREEPHVGEIMTGRSALEEVAEHYDRQVLDEELNGLPEELRQPLVLHYLLGQTNTQIAEQLRLTVRTIEGRQRRGKMLLRRRMAMRKVSLPAALTALAASNQAVQATTLAPLVEATVTAGLGFAAGDSAAGVSSNSIALGQTEAIAMGSTLTPASMIVGATVVFGTALGLLGQQAASPGGNAQLAALLLQSATAAQTDAGAGESATGAAGDSLFAVDAAAESNAPADDPFGDFSNSSGASEDVNPFGDPRAADIVLEQDPFGASNPRENENVGNPFGAPFVVQPPLSSRVNDIVGTELNSQGSIVTAEGHPLAKDQKYTAEATDTAANTFTNSGVVDLSDTSPSAKRINAALRSQLTGRLEFLGAPLSDVAALLSEEYGIPILFDTTALDAAIISNDTEVSLVVDDISLGAALRLLLQQAEDLTYVVENEVLLITTTDEAETRTATRVYDVSKLGFGAEEIAERLPKVVAPHSWSANGTGKGDVVAFGNVAIAVMQTQRIHEEVVDFLEQLHRFSEQRGKPQAGGYDGGGRFGNGGGGSFGGGGAGGGGGFF